MGWLDKNQRIVGLLYFLYTFVLLQFIFQANQVSLLRTLVNYLIILPVLGLLLILTRSYQVAFGILSGLLYAAYWLDGMIYNSRLTHIRYSDLFAVSDASRVADRYSLTFSGKDAFVLAVVVAVNLLLIFVSRRSNKAKNKKEVGLVGAGVLAVSLALLISGTVWQWIPNPMVDSFDTNTSFDRAGLYYSLYGQLRNSRVTPPEGYSAEQAERILSRYEGQEEEIEPVRVIVIMNESLADYSLVGETSFTDPLKNIHDPENGYFEGTLAVSVIGGNTCNTEFEFLTGCSLQFLPVGCLPFPQLLTSDLPSLAREMKDLGMSADGIHPYYSQEWNRRQVYRFLGFDRLIAGEDFSVGLMNADEIENVTAHQLNERFLDFGSDLEYIRGFISDAECYRKVTEVLEEQSENAFVFAVTMQNHGGYEYSGADFTNTEFIPEEPALNQYLTCTAISDASFQALIEQLAKDREKTIVLMFGDHQPGLDFSNYVKVFAEKSDNDVWRYDVPYIVWSNFPLEAELPAVTSPNYLSALLKECAGLPLTAWDRLRLEVVQRYPVLNANYVMDENYCILNKEEWEGSEQLTEYETVQYYRLFTEKR